MVGEKIFRESISQTGIAVIFHPARRIVVALFWVRFKPTFPCVGVFGTLEHNPEPGITFRCSQDLGPSSALSLIKVRFARRLLTAEFWFREGLGYPLETVRESRPSPPEQACCVPATP